MKALTNSLLILLSCISTTCGALAYDENELDQVLNGQLKPEMPQVEPAKVEAPKVEAPKVETQRADAEVSPYGAKEDRKKATSESQEVKVTGIPNFRQVTPTIFRGGQPTVESLQQLYASGVRTIVNLRNEDVLVAKEEKQARSLGMKYINIPLDVFNPPSDKAIQQFLKVMDTSQSSPVFVHCLHGQDRTGTMVALYRIRRQNWTPTQAYNEMLACGFRPGFGRLAQAVNPGAPTGAALVDALERKFRKNPTSQRTP